MKWTIEIQSEREDIDSAIFRVYLDIKKKKYITKQPYPSVMSELDCDCKEKIKYCVKK